MKKFLSLILAVAMIVSCFAAFAITTSAADGDWEVYGLTSDHDEDTPELGKSSIPGKTYTENGLELDVPENLWADFAPWAKFETKNAVDLKEGFYMKVRVDDFTYAGDMWHAFAIKKYPHLEDMTDIGSNPGLQASMRLNESDHTIKASWKIPYFVNEESAQVVYTATPEDNDWDNDVDDQGRPTYTFQVKYDETAGYSIYLNGNLIAQTVMDALREAIDGNNGLMYVSFLAQNTQKGGVVDFTLLEYGTSPEDCAKPVGDDDTDPVVRSLSFECEDPSTVEEGKPAIVLRGKEEGVFAWVTTSGKTTYNEDNSVTATFPDATTVWVHGNVDFDTNYDIKDFPIAIAIFKNLCTCKYEDTNWDLVIDEQDAVCVCGESGTAQIMAGDVMKAGGGSTPITFGLTDAPRKDADGNTYNYAIIDHTTAINKGFTGRIHGMRIDISKLNVVDAGRNTFDILEICYFRNLEDAAAYFDAMMEELGVNAETDPVETDPVETDPVETDPAEKPETQAPANTDDKGGCGSVVGVGAIAVVAIAAAGLVSFKKKED